MAIALKHERWLLSASAALSEFAADGEFDLVREIVDVFLSDSQGKVDSLQKSVRAGDFAEARRTAHSLKGAASQMGLLRMAEDAERLERSPAEIGTAAISSLVLAIQERWSETKQSMIETRDSLPSSQT